MQQNDDEQDIIIDEDAESEENAISKLKKLRTQLKECQSEKAEYLAGWQRSKADFINARRDEEMRMSEHIKYSSLRILKEILSVLDSLDSAGDKQIAAQLRSILRKEGIKEIETTDQQFNPLFHEALMKDEVEDKKMDEIILEELQKGYMIHDKVLRPSKVKVGIYKDK